MSTQYLSADLVVIPVPGACLCLPSARQYELYKRVSFGFSAFSNEFHSSVWLLDILDNAFTTRFFEHRVKAWLKAEIEKTGEPFYLPNWLDMYGRMSAYSRRIQLPLSSLVVGYGMDLEDESILQDIQYHFLDDLWKGAAAMFKDQLPK